MRIVFYQLFLLLYQISARFISPWNRKAKQWVEGRKNIMAQMEASDMANQQATIWMHCASVGEFEQGRPVLEEVRKTYPNHKILVTFFSPSGYEAKKNYAGADYIFYLPIDSKYNAKRLLDMVRPSLVLWVKYDYWFYYLNELKNRKIPTLLVSGIFLEGQVFFRWYGGFYRKMLQSFTHIFVQTEESKKLLGTIGIYNNVTVSGDTRFDRVIEIAENFEPIDIIASFCGDRPVIVAGSTWEEDEELLDHYANVHPEIKFIIAPHEIEESRLKEVEVLFRNVVRFSAFEKQMKESETVKLNSKNKLNPAANVLIIDNIGMLARLYKYASIAYVGGGFGDDGVHNVLEAAVYGKPIVHGPVIEKFAEAIELVEIGGSFVIDSALEAEKTFDRLLLDYEEYSAACKASKNYVYEKRGATVKIMNWIQENRLLTN
jgi:3-deoxy-D-manno-octulosonic-acid transferase